MRLDQPIMVGDTDRNSGSGRPRIVKLEDTYYMMYTGFGDRFPGDYRICLATSTNLIAWEKKE